MKRTIHVQSGHTLFVSSIDRADLPKNLRDADDFKTFYRVQNFDADGCTFFHLGKGHADAPKQIVVWYRNGRLWYGYGTSIEDAINGAQKDGWLYAE